MQSFEFLGKKISGPFTIPSGIITTHTSIIQKFADDFPEIGVITTKSIGLAPKEGYREPIMTQYAPDSYMNAVGLTNPGAEYIAQHFKHLNIPEDRFLLISIFGKDKEEFVKVAKILEPYADGFELNLSCPHAQGYGMSIGQDENAVYEIVKAVKDAVKIPIIPKLTPNVQDIKKITKAAVDAGADALCAINTVGPGSFSHDGHPILSNRVGGMSGAGILPLGLKCVNDMHQVTDIPIIGCGGIRSINDIIAYKNAGATIYGVGSSLVGLNTKELKEYFNVLYHEYLAVSNNKKTIPVSSITESAESLLKKVPMQFSRFTLVKNEKPCSDLSLLYFDKPILGIGSGQFVFVWIPGVGEKPFSVLDERPMVLAIQERGCFTKHIMQLKPGDAVYIRGPYGEKITPPKNTTVIMVGGGTGIASLYHIAREFSGHEVFVGARDTAHLFYLEELKKVSKVTIATNDGSLGYKGFITLPLQERLQKLQPNEKVCFINCGPPAMIAAAVEIQKKYTSEKLIFNSVDYVTKCGIGICGSCATPDGLRSCIDGPFITADHGIGLGQLDKK